MLSLLFLFLTIAIVSAILGFSVIVGITALVLRVIFLVFIILFVITLFSHLRKGRNGSDKTE